MRHSFRIQTSWIAHPAYVRVSVYDTVKEMQEATGDHVAGGLCQRWYVDSFDDDGKELPTDYDGKLVAHIHLHKAGLGAGVVSHECTHAALQIYENCFGQKQLYIPNVGEPDEYENKYGTENYSREELFAYTVGDLVRKVYNHLYKHKLIGGPTT